MALLLDYFSKKIAELNGINETKFDTGFDLYYKYDKVSIPRSDPRLSEMSI